MVAVTVAIISLIVVKPLGLPILLILWGFIGVLLTVLGNSSSVVSYAVSIELASAVDCALVRESRSLLFEFSSYWYKEYRAPAAPAKG